MHAERAALLILGDRLDHRSEDVRVDLRPVEIADVEKIGARDLAEARHVHAAGEQAAVDIGKGVGPAGQICAAARSSIFVFMARNSVPITSWVLDESRALICAIVSVNRPLPLKMSVSSAKKQKISRAMKWFMSWRRSAVPHSGLSFRSST